MTRQWTPIKEYSDILFDYYNGIARITINRPEVYNAFRPQTNHQILEALGICRDRSDIRVVVLTAPETRLFAAAATSITKAVVATAMPTTLRVLTFWMYTRLYARSPSPSLLWSTDMP